MLKLHKAIVHTSGSAVYFKPPASQEQCNSLS